MAMDLFSRDELRTLLGHDRTPRISVFMPTTRGGGQEDKILWKNRLREAEDLLTAAGRRAPEVETLLRPGRVLLEDTPFWMNVSDGLAAFFAPELARCYRLPLSFTEQVAVGQRFQVKPLLPLLSGNGRFYLLAVSHRGVRLFLGTRRTIQEVDLQRLPADLSQVPRYEEGYWRMAPAEAEGGAGLEVLIPGPAAVAAGSKEEVRRYFQRVDHGLQRLLRADPAPLVLAGEGDLVGLYRQASSSGHLLPEDVEVQPDRFDARGLHDPAWAAVQSHFQQVEEKVAALYRQLAGTGRTTNDLAQIVAAAHQGQIQYLFVTLGREQWGTFDPATGQVALHPTARTGDEDLVNLAAVYALSHKATVYPVEPGRAPDNTPLAALYWLPIGERSSKRMV
jgi:hypothetical protein